MDIQQTNNSNDDCGCTMADTNVPPVDPILKTQSDRFFTSLRADAYKCVRPTEKDILAVPWGPRVDVMFDPKRAPGIVGGRVRVMARTSGTEVEIANIPITSDSQPIAVSVATGCDEYVVKAMLGLDPGLTSRRVESYVYARVYNGR